MKIIWFQIPVFFLFYCLPLKFIFRFIFIEIIIFFNPSSERVYYLTFVYFSMLSLVVIVLWVLIEINSKSNLKISQASRTAKINCSLLLPIFSSVRTSCWICRFSKIIVRNHNAMATSAWRAQKWTDSWLHYKISSVWLQRKPMDPKKYYKWSSAKFSHSRIDHMERLHCANSCIQ